jgi:glycosyltransferase involved in cell wall biosynthesis
MIAARVSVGVPVFNLERTLPRALDSILGQTFGDFELLVFDNASTDGTEAICRRYAGMDARVNYVRHPVTVPAFENFRSVLAAARAPYFMWLAADDYALPQLLERATAALDGHPDVVCAAPRVEFVAADGRRKTAAGSFALLGGVRENLWQYLRDPLDNSRFYGLYRRDVVRRVFPKSPSYGFDWAIAAGTLLYGKHAELADILLVREASDPLKYMRMIDDLAPNRLARLLPLAPFTRTVLVDLKVAPRPRTLYALLRINAIHHVLYSRYRYPRYGRLLYRVALILEQLGCGGARRFTRALPGRRRAGP